MPELDGLLNNALQLMRDYHVDDALHFGISAAVFSLEYRRRLRNGTGAPKAAALAALEAMALGAFKEIIFDPLTGLGSPKLTDVLWDAAGIAAGAAYQFRSRIFDAVARYSGNARAPAGYQPPVPKP